MKNDPLPGWPLLELSTPHARNKGHADWNPTDGVYKQLLDDALEVFDRYRNHLPLGQ